MSNPVRCCCEPTPDCQADGAPQSASRSQQHLGIGPHAAALDRNALASNLCGSRCGRSAMRSFPR